MYILYLRNALYIVFTAVHQKNHQDTDDDLLPLMQPYPTGRSNLH